MRARTAAQALVWFTMALPMFLAVAGLAIDAGMLLASRRQLQSVADGAARAGATRLDVQKLRASGGGDVELDPQLAVAAASSYLEQRVARDLVWQASPTIRIDAAPRRVHVVIQGTLRTAFLRVVQIESVPVEATAFADVQFGIRDGGGG
jgi:Flp pilus assembly protein TadG